VTTVLLGFENLNYNVVYAQMGRGKSERITAMALANIADTLAKMSMDACLYLNQNFDFRDAYLWIRFASFEIPDCVEK
jgi:argininosuccinate lyase